MLYLSGDFWKKNRTRSLCGLLNAKSVTAIFDLALKSSSFLSSTSIFGTFLIFSNNSLNLKCFF